MSSSWSEIRSRANNDPLLDTISDLQAKANQSEALNNITTTDKIPPIRIIRSKVEIHDKGMMTGYTRPRNVDTAYYMGTEPDGDHLRLQARFDSACDSLNDYSMQGNTINIGYQDTLPVLLKATEDDGVTAGDMVSVVDGATQYYRIPVTDAISIKKMVLDGKPGITILYRHFPLFINNELNSTGMQRATPVYMMENDQVEYAVKWEVDDSGYVYFFFRHQFINYYVRTVNPVIAPPPVPDYYAPDFSPLDFDSAQNYYDIPFPTPYIDLAMEFNFATKAISMYVNAVLVPTTTTAVTLVPPLPAPIFPPAFADPPPPPEQPEPFFQPFVKVYEQLNDTSALKVNAVTTTLQNAFYNVPGTPPTTDPLETIVSVTLPPNSLYPTGSGGTPPTTVDWTNINNYVLLYEASPTDNSGVSLSNTTNISTAVKIDSSTVGSGPNVVGKVVHRLSFSYKRVGGVTGTLYGRIWDASGNILVTFGGADGLPITVATGQSADPVTGYSFANVRNIDNTHVMAVGDRIGFEFIPSGTGEFMIQRTATSIDPAFSISTRAVGAGPTSWTIDTTHDLYTALWRKKTDAELAGGTGGGGGGTDDQFLPVQIPAQPSNGIIKYRGGPVWDNANVHIIFSGSNWNTRTTPYSKQRIIDALHLIFDSAHYDGLLQYGIKKPKLKTTVVNTGITLSTNFTNNDVTNLIQDSISKNLVPGLTNGVQNLYFIMSPYHALSETDTFAYHDALITNSSFTSPTTQGFPWGIIGVYENWAAVVAVTAHEIAEMLTTPFNLDGHAGWTADGPPDDATNQPPEDNEIGDWCELAAAQGLKGFLNNEVAVYPTWSNLDGGCKAFVAPPTWLTCPTGFTYQTSTQQCFKPGTGGGGGGGGGGTPTLVSIGEITSTTNSGATLSESNNDAVAMFIADVSSGLGQKMNGKTIHTAEFGFSPANNPTGRIFCKIWDENDNEMGKVGPPDGADVSTFAAVDVDGDGWMYHKFVGGGSTVTIKEGYKIGVEWKTSDSDAEIRVRRVSTNVDDSVCQASRSAGDPDFRLNESYDPDVAFWTEVTTTQPAPLPAPLPDPQPAGDGGAVDTFGVKATYSSATGSAINYNWIENFQSDSYRFDWEGLGTTFASAEMIGYFRFTSSPPDDEVAGKMGGGTHSTGSHPKCYDMGVGITDGATRYRLEENHPTTNGGSSGGTGKTLGSSWVGYKYVKWNKGTSSVLLEIWQDQGNNEGSTPANQWVRLASWNVTSPLWLTPPSDHQETLRIDGVDDNLEWKWLSLRPIGATDTGTTGGGTGGGGTGGGGGTVTTYDTWPSSSILSNNLLSDYIAAQTFGSGVDLIGSIPTIISFAIWRNDSATSGKYYLRHYDSAGNVKKTLSSEAVVTLPSLIPDNRNIIWQDVLNDTPILDNDMIGVEVEGVINTARVYVMNNKVFRGEVSGGTTIPGTTTPGTTLSNTPPILANPPSSVMKLYHTSGCTLSSAVVHLIFWGNDWKTRKSAFSKDDVTAALDQVFQSRFWDGLIQYGIKRPRRGVSVISTAYPDYDNYSQQDIIEAIAAAILKGDVPKQTPDNKQVYMLIPNPTQDIGNDPGLQSASGYHTAFYMDIDPAQFHPQSTFRPGEEVYMPFGWTRAWPNNFDQLMITITHEICEIITDPYPAWERLGVAVNNVTSAASWASLNGGGEICDICPGIIFNGHATADWRSNQDNACVGNNNAPTWISCSTGRTWNASIQECVGNKAGTTTTPPITIGGTYSNDFDDVRSCIATRTIGSSTFTSGNRTVDLCVQIKRGGGDFIGYIELNNRRKRVGAKANQDGSLLIGKVMSKMDVIMKRVGTTALTGLVRCNIRDSLGQLMQEFGTFDATSIALTDTPITFINTQQTYAMVQGDVVSIEYDTGGSSTTSPTSTITAPTIPAQPATQGMIYQGGPVYSEANVYIILDGATWNTLTTPFTKANFITACDTVFASTYFDALLQYGIKKPKFHNYIVNTTLPLPSTYTRDNTLATVQNSIATGQVPSNLPTSQHNIYVVVAAPGKTFTPPAGLEGVVSIKSHFSTSSLDVAGTATVWATVSFPATTTLGSMTNQVFKQVVQLATWPIATATGTPPDAWKVNPAVLSTANGTGICGPGEGLNPIIGTTGGGTGDTGGGGGTGATSGSVDSFGVKASYATGQIKYDFVENFRPDGKRFDFEGLGSTFPSVELIGYFADNNNPNDEVSGKCGGGEHSTGSRPRVYDMGIDTVSGATRYRTEDFHPEYTGGQSGPSGTGLKSTYTGYKFIKWNQGTSSVKLEIWQDRGNNEGSTPANEWVRVATWNVTDPLWLIPPSDHQETIRIDSEDGVPTLRWKWLSLREIKPTDTALPGTQNADIGVTVAAYYSNLDHAVVPPPAAPSWITCSTGTYNSTIQSCISSTIGGGSNPASGSYLMVRASQGFFNAADASKTMLFEGVLPNIDYPSTIYNRDLAGVMYTGGRQDLQARPIRGVKVATAASILYDKVITEVRLRLKGTGILALGNLLRVKIVRGTDKVTVASIGSLDINSISTTQFIEYYFQNPDNKYRMKVGDLVALEFNHGNSDFNYLEVKTSTPQIIDVHNPQPLIPTYDGTNTIMFEYTGKSWIDESGRDITGSMSIGGYTVEPDPIVIPPPPPFHYAHEWFISASAPVDSNALQQPSDMLPVPYSHYNNISKEFRIYDFLLTPLQLENYYQNRFTITPLQRGQIEVVGHDVTPISTS